MAARMIWLFTFITAILIVALYFLWPATKADPLGSVVTKDQPKAVVEEPAATPILEEKATTTPPPDPESTFFPSPEAKLPVAEEKDELKSVEGVNVDETGREQSFSARTRAAAHDLIEQKNGLNPGTEFDALSPMTFKSEPNGMLSGHFREETTGSEFALLSEEDGKISSMSCVFIPETGANFAAPGKMEAKADQDAYGILLLKKKWIMRMTYGFRGPQRVLVARLFEANGNDWTKVRDIEAYEIRKPDKLTKCEAENSRD